MIYPGMARLVPVARPPGAGPPIGPASRGGQVAPIAGQRRPSTGPQASHASVLRAAASPNPAHTPFIAPLPSSSHRRPVPGLAAVPGTAGRVQQQHAQQLPISDAEASFVAMTQPSSMAATPVPRRDISQQPHVRELGVAADEFRIADLNVVKLVAEALVFVGLVLLKWAGSLSKPEQVTTVIKAGLVAVFFALHPVYAIIATAVVVATYLYEKMHIRSLK